MAARFSRTILQVFGRRSRIAFYLLAVGTVTPLAAEDAPKAPVEHPRPSVEQRRVFEERMRAIQPTKPGCFEAHYPEERWVETECLPAPRTPSPHHANGPHPTRSAPAPTGSRS